MSELATTRTLEVIGAEIRALTASMLGNVIEIGRRMVEAKELLPHGEFGPWIKENTGYSNSTANNFMRLFLEYGNKQASLFGAEVENFQTFGNLSYTKALALLALPSEEEREEFVETHDVEAMSTRELQQAIRERDEARKALQTSEARLADTQRTLADTDKQMTELRGKLQEAWDDVQAADEQAVENERALKARIAELEARPVEVAVQEPDPAEVEKRARVIAQEEIDRQTAAANRKTDAAVKERELAIKKMGDLKKKAEEEKAELERKLKEAEDKLASAGSEDKAEAEQLRAETEQLRKQLAMSGQEVTAARIRFKAWQDAYRELQKAAEAIPGEGKDSIYAAMKAQAKLWAEGGE